MESKWHMFPTGSRKGEFTKDYTAIIQRQPLMVSSMFMCPEGFKCVNIPHYMNYMNLLGVPSVYGDAAGLLLTHVLLGLQYNHWLALCPRDNIQNGQDLLIQKNTL